MHDCFDMIWSFCVYNSVFLFTTSCYPGNIFPYSYQLCRNMLLLLLLLLSRFGRVRLCATPQTSAHQALLPLGFSRQVHWSGLPFPSPMHESESEVAQSCLTLLTAWTAAHQAPPSMGFSRQKYWSGVPLPSLLQEHNFCIIVKCI